MNSAAGPKGAGQDARSKIKVAKRKRHPTWRLPDEARQVREPMPGFSTVHPCTGEKEWTSCPFPWRAFRPRLTAAQGFGKSSATATATASSNGIEQRHRATASVQPRQCNTCDYLARCCRWASYSVATRQALTTRASVVGVDGVGWACDEGGGQLAAVGEGERHDDRIAGAHRMDGFHQHQVITRWCQGGLAVGRHR